MAKEPVVSLGGINYGVRALFEMCWLTLQNFNRSKCKLRCSNSLMSERVSEKSELTAEFLRSQALQAKMRPLKYNGLSLKLVRLWPVAIYEAPYRFWYSS